LIWLIKALKLQKLCKGLKNNLQINTIFFDRNSLFYIDIIDLTAIHLCGKFEPERIN